MAQSPIQMRSLFVGNIPKDLESPEEFLANLFGKFGLILSVKVCRDINTQKSLGHAYVNFQNAADAERAQQQLNYSELPNYPGRELRVAFSERDPTVRARGKALFVKNLDTAMTNKSLQELFAAYGVIIDCSQATDSQGKKLGFGTVQFAEPEAADKALAALNGTTVNGKELSIAVKEREEDKTYTKIFVRNIRPDATDDEIRIALGAHAKPAGAVASLVINANPANNTRSAIIDMGDHEAAVAAIAALNDKPHETLTAADGAPLTAVANRKPVERRSFVPSILQNDGRNLYVKFLPDHMDEKELRALFSTHGEIESVSLAMSGDVFRGFAFVCFKTKDEAIRAIGHLHGYVYFGRPLYVQHAQHQDQRNTMLAERSRQFAAAGPMGMPFGGPHGMMPPHMMMGGPQRGGMMPPHGMVPPHMMHPFRGPHGMMPPHMMMGGPQRGPFNGPRGPFGGPRGMGPRHHMSGPNQMNRGPRGPHQHHQQQPQQFTAAHLAGKTPEEQKNILGEKLYNGVSAIDGERAAKITGMLLELPTDEVLAAINDGSVLAAKVAEAQSILAQHA